MLKGSRNIRSNVVNHHRDAETVLTSEDMLKESCFPSALHSQQEFLDRGSRRLTKNPERSVTGKAFGGTGCFLAPLFLLPFLTLFLAILNAERQWRREKTSLRCEEWEMTWVQRRSLSWNGGISTCCDLHKILAYNRTAHQGMDPEAIKVTLSRVWVPWWHFEWVYWLPLAGTWSWIRN